MSYKMLFERSTSFDRFTQVLEKFGIIEITERAPRIIDAPRFWDFGFGLFLAWVIVSVRPRETPLRFVWLDDDNLLLLVEPVGRQSILPSNFSPSDFPDICIDKGSLLWPAELDGPMGCFSTNYLRLNALALDVHTFVPEKIDVLLDLVDRKRLEYDCEDCRVSKVRIIRDLIQEYPAAGRLLGGYPLLINVAPQVFWECLGNVAMDNMGKGFSQETLRCAKR